ncbi:MAG: ABC transporter substrate-binding protein [Hyphomicrobium aestuarii]|nr:ABC transporter substrate-binding protein [Hyphomicrobium aestuarii]
MSGNGFRGAAASIGRCLTSFAIMVIGCAAGGMIMPATATAQPVETAEAAARPPVSIGVLVSSRTDVCFDTGQVGAITKFVKLEQNRINQRGGIGGRKLEIDILDDASKPERTVANVRKALINPSALAVVGLTNSNRAKSTFDELGSTIQASGVPFISDISVNTIFAKYPNVFTTRATQDDERLPVTVSFVKALSFQRVAFVGLKDMVFSASFADGLKAAMGEKGLAAEHRLTMTDDKFNPAETDAMAADLKAKNPDLVILAVSGARTPDILKALTSAGMTAPVLLFGRIDMLPPDVSKAYPSDLYQLAWDSLPDVFNARLRKRIGDDASETWVFEGGKIAAAPGWAKGECKERTAADPDPLEAANLRAISFGTQFADMIALIAKAAAVEGPKPEISAMRSLVMRELGSTYASGRGVFRGSFETWSFDRTSRAASRLPFIIMQPSGLGRRQLAPIQFTRSKTGALRQIATLYADVDLIRTYNIDDNDKTFFAEFYLSLRSTTAITTDDIEFVNAYLDPRTGGRQITVTNLHDGGPSAAYPAGMRIYKVSGRFLFQPDLANFPFDSQTFQISIQPKRADAPFLVQPPPFDLRDKTVDADGWDVRAQYVGYDSDFVPIVDAFTLDPSVVPFYTSNFVWQMDRQTTDYYLRVVVPLAFILIVAYLSIFIPQIHFEAIVTIQVTALLSAVALYFSIPKVSSDTATISDRIFVFDYMLVCLMIVISILRVNRHVASRPWLKTSLLVIHVAGFPILVVAMGWYIMDITNRVR